jgi:phosphate transport system permease protein
MKRFWKSGDPFIWLTGGALAFSLLMIVGLVTLILFKGLGQFWPSPVYELTLEDGSRVLGEKWGEEKIPHPDEAGGPADLERIRLKIGNRDLYPLDFRWIDEADIAKEEKPPDAVVLERREWGNFYGFLQALEVDGRVTETGLREALPVIRSYQDRMEDLRDRIEEIEKDEIGDINHRMEELRLGIRGVRMESDTTTAGARENIQAMQREIERLQAEYQEKESHLTELYEESKRYVVTMETVDGREKDVDVFDIVRLYLPNRMGVVDKSLFYAGKVWEFVSGEPRESNTEGGVFPAIFGTVLMVIIMSIAVVPLGVLAAVYLREYARQGPLVRIIRIAVNNLAGVPSIVYGVFGLGFFIYAIGGTIDSLFFPEALPTPTFGTGGILWASLTLALLTVPVVIVATEEGLAAVPQEIREGSIALAATKFETLWRIVVPGALPGIMTGLILAIARAAGEVAPLMITGVVKIAPALPVDGYFPYLHLERKFMHLGFHIYDVGFQSPNVEAATPMVYSTTLLLLLIVMILNVTAIAVRNRLRRRLSYSVF